MRRPSRVRGSGAASRRLLLILALVAAAGLGAQLPLDAPWPEVLALGGLLVLPTGSLWRWSGVDDDGDTRRAGQLGHGRAGLDRARDDLGRDGTARDDLGRDDVVAREQLALRACGVGTWHWHVDGGALAWSGDVESSLGLAGAFLGSSLRDHLCVVHPADRDELLVRLGEAVAARADVDAVYRVVDGQRDIAWVQLIGSVITDVDGRVETVSGIVFDASRHAVAIPCATVDQLRPPDGLPTRAALVQALDRALHNPGRGELLGLLVVDVRNVHEINDALGHHVGDRFLAAMSDRLCDLGRGDDLVARVGGCQFVILPRGVRSADGFSGLATAVLTAMEAPVVLEGVELHAVLNLGIAVEAPGVSAAELLQQADIASRQARTLPGSFLFYSAADETGRRRRLALVGALKEALRRGDFELYYQPKAHLTTGEVVGVEALLRWPQPDGGVLGPSEFLPLAEQTGLMEGITAFVLRRALQQCRVWLDDGLRVPVAVNVPPDCIAASGFAERVVAELTAAGVDPDLLTLEITETSLASAVQAPVADRLLILRRLGVCLSVDDFGTGYSSLAYLKHLPVQEIKIDRAFLTNASSDYRDQAVVAATLTLGRVFSMEVVAEGIETERAADLMRRLGCRVGQGFGLAPPMPAAELNGLLAASAAAASQQRLRAGAAHRTCAVAVDDLDAGGSLAVRTERCRYSSG